ncbi:MAG: hypothetical protein KDB24_18125 [Microthrixaceae bacterium]|nr:hypothetical protein [Microthrixaceae bacterium]
MGSTVSSTTRPRGGLLSRVALALVLGLTFAAPVGAQDGGDSYTTSGPIPGDGDGNGIPDDVEDAILASDLGSCNPGSYTVGVPFSLQVPAPVDGTQEFLINQYSDSIRLFNGTAPSGSVEVTSPLAGEHALIFYGVDGAGETAAVGCRITGTEVGGESTPNTPGTTGGDTGGTSASTGTAGSTGTSGSGTSGTATAGGSGPLATTGFGAALPSLLATALVVCGGLLTITVARRRRAD